MRDLLGAAAASGLAFGLAAASAAAQTPAQHAAVATGDSAAVAALRRAADAAAARGDGAAFRALVTDDFGFAHSTGVVDDAAQYLGRPARPDTVRLLGPTRFLASGDLAVVAAHGTVHVPGRGWAELRATDVYRRDRGHWRWAWHQTTSVAGRPAFVAVEPAVLDAYAGRYTAPDGRAHTVTREGDHLTVAFPAGDRGTYRALTPALFRAQAVGIYLAFGRDASGAVAYVDLFRADRNVAERLVRAP